MRTVLANVVNELKLIKDVIDEVLDDDRFWLNFGLGALFSAVLIFVVGLILI